jgi:TetR/AcrR family transcriptional regulator, transcriptional repressor for nem operon
MARPRAFEREQVLEMAINVFREKGFEGTSTDDLVKAMNIGRQSLYATFGDKRSLYLEALRRYNSGSVSDRIRVASHATSPIKVIESILLDFAELRSGAATTACLGVNAICEFGKSDADVTRINHESGKNLQRFLERTIRDARAVGEIDDTVEPKAAAQFIAATIVGMKVSARGGADTRTLRNIARFALRSLKR